MSSRAVLKIIREEVHYALFTVRIPDVPWSKAPKVKRVCENAECGVSFVPARWFSRFCSRPCYSRVYGIMYRAWKARRGRFYLRKGGR